MHKEIQAKIQATNATYAKQKDKGRRDLLLEPGDLVWIHLKKERFPSKRKNKLSPRGEGPFKVLEKVNNNAYRVELPEEFGGVHPVFNVADLTLVESKDETCRLKDQPLEGGGDGVIPQSKHDPCMKTMQDRKEGMLKPITELTAILSRVFKEQDQTSPNHFHPFWSFNTLIKHYPNSRNQLIHLGRQQEDHRGQICLFAVKRSTLRCNDARQGSSLDFEDMGSVLKHNRWCGKSQTDLNHTAVQEPHITDSQKPYYQKKELRLSTHDPELVKAHQWIPHVPDDLHGLYGSSKEISLVNNQEFILQDGSFQRLASFQRVERPFTDPGLGRLGIPVEGGSEDEYDPRKAQGSILELRKGKTEEKGPNLQKCSLGCSPSHPGQFVE